MASRVSGHRRVPALYLQVHGQTDPEPLQRVARRFQEELMARPEISKLRVWGQRKPEIRIEIEPYLLERHDLTIKQIVGIIQQASLRFQAGTLKTEGGDIVLRADDLAHFGGDYRDISLLEIRDGSKVRLDDIATITDGYGDEEIVARFDGNPTVGMEVLIAQRENLLQISKAVRETITDFEPQLPPEIQIASWGDSAGYISERLSLLRTNAFQGLLLVTVILAIFLNARLAFWVAMGIPISAAGAIFVSGTKWVDYSLNDVTTFGLIIALGILVDDAVVVGESVFEERAKEKDPILGTENGVNKIAVATVFGVMTTIAAFFPMLLIENAIGKIFASFSGIIILALLFSLLKSKLILPAHLAHLSLDAPASEPSGMPTISAVGIPT
jgi:multidrug efflux pump subunit AcrB